MFEPQTKELFEEEINLNFFIQVTKVTTQSFSYHKLYAKIKDMKNEGTEITYQYLSPDEIKVATILKQIAKLYDLYKNTNNDDLIKGAREEILKLITLLIWNIYH
ncbi:B104 [Sulfolobus spindle-shaped virus Lassen]|nr:B104 [Sulfolobus spindle-shaped virus Lassen]